MTATSQRVPQQVCAAVLALVRDNPGRRAGELSAVCGSVALRAWLPTALLALRERCDVRTDETGAYWPTGS
ncbi:hypothetical protein [Streptomyces sp. NPDC048188]|uniref:hypothetical protein n=1 Tax=Streptomyces sp. NPDC048188 TaxID=3155749 RepID=UPI0034473339